MKLRYDMSKVNGEYSGFIPCLMHAKQIARKKITLESLIKDRDASAQPFPIDWSKP